MHIGGKLQRVNNKASNLKLCARVYMYIILETLCSRRFLVIGPSLEGTELRTATSEAERERATKTKYMYLGAQL